MRNATRRIRVAPVGAKAPGFRILVCWRRPGGRSWKRHADAWAPALAPSHVLRERHRAGVLSWSRFLELYRVELGAPSAQDLLRPLGLLSKRRSLVILCECRDRARCPERMLARALAACRRRGRFTVELGGRRLP